ncbi:F-box only protein 34 [Clinocottus analis]|uniref:F-box only protein 34 n=1 Tax=Clinocottus analis TaxID=304258 RepID=UPI0035BF4771
MHLKSSQCSSLFVRTCSGNHGNISRPPLGVLSTNGLLKATPLLEDGAAPLDVWAVIKPGNVREKIAIFAPDGSGRTAGPGRAKRRRGEAAKAKQLSVEEMVAFLEQQPDSKPPLALQRSSASITLSRAPPPEVRGEEPESVRVSDMVAKLESECLRRRTEGDLSRSNSLRRTVGRVLLAAGDRSPAPCWPSSPTSYSEPALTTPPSAEAQGVEPLSSVTEPPPEEAEPLPGLLFLSGPRPLPHRMTLDTEPFQPRPPPASPPEVVGASALQDFLSLRRRLQWLLEPRPLLAALPPPLLLAVLRLLPTRSLAALKCSCHYFLFVIEHYGVRPADALWVSDPRYRDDPCKQCKRRRSGGGDVSACRWHHKPFCQALPGAPGFWMCCRARRRDAPGCNVGLHDNRWVPAFHSINAPLYRRGRHDD